MLTPAQAQDVCDALERAPLPPLEPDAVQREPENVRFSQSFSHGRSKTVVVGTRRVSIRSGGG
jgi:hypothetical protein